MTEEQIEQLEELVKLQCTNGTWNYDSYHFGMANGLILALAVMKGEEPQFLKAPAQWLEDNEKNIIIESVDTSES